ncbi:MAG: Ig-like domain-containing protein [Candidatus Aminicenantes bacterium]|jgi:hypothetical protein
MKKMWIMQVMLVGLCLLLPFSVVSAIETPEFSIDRTTLYFGFLKNSNAKTGIQTITVSNSADGTLIWDAAVFEDDLDYDHESEWLKITNIMGTQSGRVGVWVNPLGLDVGVYDGAVKFTDPNASNSPQMVKVILTVYAAQSDDPPFGSFDTPVDGSVVMSSIPVTGWALDDIGIDEVTIWRDAEDGSREIYIGEAVQVEGPRPDIEQTYPTYPMSYKGGWGYMLLTNMLPNGGNGTFILHAYAKDLAGQKVKLGSKTIVCDNANAVKPFGAIDTPEQGGETPKGPYIIFRNQGWVLTPMPNQIPTDGSTIKVYIDGQHIGNCIYNIYREDIAALFPGYANSEGAMAYLDFDTDVYDTGLHTIQWVVTDNAGNRDGIGSRYFTLQNYGYNDQAAGQTTQVNTTGKSIWGIKMRTGYREDNQPRKIAADQKGMIHISIPQDERIVLDLSQPGGISYSGYMKVNRQLRSLPPGASMDTQNGMFYWQPGPASFGKYHLVFLIKSETGRTNQRIVNIEITPKFTGRFSFH